METRVKFLTVTVLALWVVAPAGLAQVPGGSSQPGPMIQQAARDAFRKEDQLENLLGLQREADLTAKNAYDHADYSRARRLFLPLAEGDSSFAQYYLGVMFSKGQGGPRDDAAAARWFRKAADKDVPQAQFSLAMAYLAGHGLTTDSERGARWLRLAADHGLPQDSSILACSTRMARACRPTPIGRPTGIARPRPGE